MTTEAGGRSGYGNAERYTWLKKQNWGELQTLANIWRTVSPLDRQFYATMSTTARFPDSTGNPIMDAATMIGADDIREEFVGTCPIPFVESKTAQDRSKRIEEDLINKLSDRGIDINRGKLMRMFWAFRDVSTSHLPDQPSAGTPEWMPHHHLSGETYWRWLAEGGKL